MISDILFYERSGGQGEFYTTYLGAIELLQQHTDWRPTWTRIVPGNFGGSGFTDLLFYEGATGEFYTTDGKGGIHLLKQHTDWRTSWTHLVPGNFGGSGFTDLLFYEAASGTGEFYTTDGKGGIQLLKQHTNWRTSWTQIIPGNFGGSGFTDLLFYEAATGTGEFYTTDGKGGIRLLKRHTGWRTSWTHIVPGNFGGSGFTDLLFYEAATGTGEFYTTDGKGGMQLLRGHTGWRTSWTKIIPGLYAPPQAVRLHLKLLVAPKDPIETQLAQIREAYLPAGMRVIVRSIEFLNLPHLIDVEIGSCKDGFGDNITGDVAELYSHRRNVGENELAIYFVRSTMEPTGGCAKFPNDKAGAIVTNQNFPYVLAHEVGHVLGLNHVDNSDFLMHPGDRTNPPPDLSSGQKFAMMLSKYSIDL